MEYPFVVRQSPERGRYTVAVRTISTGELIDVVEMYAGAIDESQRKRGKRRLAIRRHHPLAHHVHDLSSISLHAMLPRGPRACGL